MGELPENLIFRKKEIPKENGVSKRDGRGKEASRTEIPLRERAEDEFEKMESMNVTRVIIRGSVPLALMAGKDLKLARDIDVFVLRSGYGRELKVESFENIAEFQQKAGADVQTIIKRMGKFVQVYGLENLPIQVVETSEEFLQEVSLYEDEPEVVLWDVSLELKSQVLKPLGVKEKEALLKRIQTLIWRQDLNLRDLGGQIEGSYEVHLYKTGKLYRGHSPDFLGPSTDRLAAALRLADLGERFGIPYGDLLLRAKDQEISRGIGRIFIPSALAGTEIEKWDREKLPGEIKKSETYPGGPIREFSLEESGAIDLAFLKVAKKPGVKELMAKKYPNLSNLVKEIESAGGIRKFIAKEYGDVYLSEVSGREYLDLSDPNFNELKISEEEKSAILTSWHYASPGYQQFFSGGLTEFIHFFPEEKIYDLSALSRDRICEMVLSRKIDRLLESGELEDRSLAYKSLGRLAVTLSKNTPEEAEKYRKIKDRLKEYLLKERSKPLRKVLAGELVSLIKEGLDLTIIHDFVDILKKESARAKAEKAKILSPEGITILRCLFALDNSEAHLAIFGLTANPSLDKRIRKLCLEHSVEHGQDLLVRKLADWVRQDLKQDATAIPWDDYLALHRVESIASSNLREKVRGSAESVFIEIRDRNQDIAEVHQSIAPKLPPEFFFVLFSIFEGNKQKIQTWERVIGAIKSNKLKESFLYSIVEMSSDLWDLITEKIISAKEITREHILLADRLLKKLHFLKALETQKAGMGESLKNLLEQAKAPSVLEAEVDKIVATSLCEITGRGDITTNKIQSLFQTWGNPEPLLVYIAEIVRRTGRMHQSFDLISEALANLDPAELQDWKQWRYNRETPLVAEQLRNLSDEQVEAYAEDAFVDLGEVLIAVLPSDKPKRVQGEIVHSIGHDWKEAGVLAERPIFRLAGNLLVHIDNGGLFDIERIFIQDIEDLEPKIKLAGNWLSLQEDLRLASALSQELASWQNAEIEKRKKLISMGYRGDETLAEIEDLIAKLRKSKENEKDVSMLASLQPNPMPSKMRSILERYGLGANAGTGDCANLLLRVQESIKTLGAQEDFLKLTRELFSREEAALEEWQGAIKDLKALQTFLRLGILSPQLIAFNKISPEKKKASLSSAIRYLKEHFQTSGPVVRTIENIEKIISEESQPVGKKEMAVIFTDNPLVSLSIGKFPAGAESCQFYWNGDINLAAYVADADKKMVLLVNLGKLAEELKLELQQKEDQEERLKIFQENILSFLDATVARRIVKIVRDSETGQPLLFLEPVYTNLNREATSRILNTFAVSHLKPKLKMELAVGGGTALVSIAKSRNCYQYEDGEKGGPGGVGGGLGTKEGSYTMPARKITEKDYLL